MERKQLTTQKENDMLQLFENGVSKQLISDHAKSIAEQVKNGELDPVRAAVQAQALQDVGKQIRSEIESFARDEATKYKEPVWGAKVEIGNTGDRLDYEKDPTYKDLKKKLKAREEQLKHVYNTGEEIYDSEGVQVPKVPVSKPSKETLKISIQ